MNAKAISAPAAPGHADISPSNVAAPSQVAMVVMLVPISTPQVQAEPAASPTYVDSHDHVWLLVEKASPMAAVFQQITAAEPPTAPANGHLHMSHDPNAWLVHAHGEPAHLDMAALGAEQLSRREIDVLQLIADGRSNQEIAQSLTLALSTIKMHVKHIYSKLGVKNRVQAVAHARALGLITATMQ